MSEALKIFVSHSHQDEVICRELVTALRAAGADVWYDKHDKGWGQFGRAIERELRDRPLFILILSPAVLAARWVEDEARLAYRLYREDKSRTILPVLAEKMTEDYGWRFLQDFKRIEAPGVQPYPPRVAVSHLLRALSLNLPEQPAVPAAPQPEESAEDLVIRGKALRGKGKHVEALPLFERATILAPQLFTAWYNLAFTFDDLGRFEEALTAQDHALQLNNKEAATWGNKGNTLVDLQRYAEALVAYEQALALDPTFVNAWNGKGDTLADLQRPDEALVAYEQALALDPTFGMAWRGKANTLSALGRHQEALEASEHALTLEPSSARGWRRKAAALRGLGRETEAKQAGEQAKERGG